MPVSPDDQSPWLIPHLFEAALGLLTATVAFLWRQIGVSRKDAIAEAWRVKDEIQSGFAKSEENWDSRIREVREDVKSTWAEIERSRTLARDEHTKLNDRQNALMDLMRETPTRRETAAALAEIKVDLKSHMDSLIAALKDHHV